MSMDGQGNHPARMPTGIADLPPNIQLVWHGVNDAANLRQFLASDVPWAELDVNIGPDGKSLILRHDTFEERSREHGEELLRLQDALPRLVDRGKSVKIDFKVAGAWVDPILDLVDRLYIPSDRLWLNGSLDFVGGEAICRLSARRPGAVIQVPLNSLDVPLSDSTALSGRLEEVTGLGVNRYSIGWRYPDVPGLVGLVKQAGSEVNIYGVANLSEFLRAVELGPAAVTADFNFPEWHHYGRGSGHKGVYYYYTMHVGPGS